MKRLSLGILFFLIGTNCFSQNFHLQVIGNSIIENKVIDSLSYRTTHSNANEINKEVELITERLYKIGYLDNHVLENLKKNDSAFVAKLNLGERIKWIHIYIGAKITDPLNYNTEKAAIEKKNYGIKNLVEVDAKNDTLTLPYSELELFLNGTLQKLEQKGFALAKLKLINIQKTKNLLFADLQFETGQRRALDEIVLNFPEGTSNKIFPAGHLKQINRKYRNTSINQKTIVKIQSDFEKFGFVHQVKNPEILFATDTTKIYVYLEKRKSNTFDGVIGFTNNENSKLTFNGYLDLSLQNSVKAGEQFSLFWKSDGNNQRTFRANVEIPYLFKTPIGLKAQINIFKQDSTFQNTKTAIDIGYFIDYKTRIYAGYQTTESTDIQNTNNSIITSYTNSFFTLNLEYSKIDPKYTTFPIKTNVSVVIGTGNRTTPNLTAMAAGSKQTVIIINAMHNIYLNAKNCININYQNYFLKSDTYITNELNRFGGTKSIRGFAENSLQANSLNAIITEYRYIITPDLYFHSILDYGFYEDKTSNNNFNLLGLGAGAGLRTKNGVLKLNFSNGTIIGQKIKGSNTLLSVNYNIEF